MSFRVVRESKFRNIFGTAWKREQCYDNIRVSKSSWDSTMCAVNPKFLAVIVESAGGGAFIVFPLHKTGRIPADFPLVGGHKGPVLDIAWCPHNDNIIASGSEDCTVRVWQIPDLALSRTLTDAVVELTYHQRRVGLVLWHPSALNVLLSVGSDNDIVIWNAGEGEILKVISCHTDIIHSACWNYDGSKIVTTCKDKKIRIIDPRTAEVLQEGVCHEGTKASRAIFLKTGLIFTTGFSKMSERQYSLRSPEHLNEPIVIAELDTSNGMMFPLYDPDHNIVYLCGKGDSVFRYYEITTQSPYVHYINMFSTPDPQRGIGMMPKRALNVSSCEIARFYRLNNSGLCQVISIQVPRKSERFQEDLYPDTLAETSALTAEEWFSGSNVDPILIAMNEVQAPPTVKRADFKVPRRLLQDKPAAGAAGPGGAGGAHSESTITAQIQMPPDLIKSFTEEIRKLKAIIVKHENRIRHLEAQFANWEATVQAAHPDDGPGDDQGQQNNGPPDAQQAGDPPNRNLGPDEV